MLSTEARSCPSTRLYEANGKHLAGIVPLVQGVIGVEALVALQPDQFRVQDLGQHLGHFRFPHPSFSFEEQGTGQAVGEVDRNRQGPVGQIAVFAEGRGHFIDGTGDHGLANST